MPSENPERLDPIRLARQDTVLTGTLPIRDLKRLMEQPDSDEQTVKYRLHFYRDEAGQNCVEGNVRATVELNCQRCMQDFPASIDTNVKLMTVKSIEQAREIPEAYDPLLLKDKILLKDVVEEELLLALPGFPLHEPEDCPVKLQKADEPEVVSKQGPFAELAKLNTSKQE